MTTQIIKILTNIIKIQIMVSLFRNFPIKYSSNVIKHSCNIINRTKTNLKSEETLKDYLIVRPVPDDYDEILCLMHKSYYSEEPTTSSIGFKPTVLFDERVLQALCQGFSHVAKCKYNGDILGACVNEATHCWDPDLMDNLACQVQDVKSRQLLHFYAHLMRLPDLWRKYCVHKIFEISWCFIRKDAREKGLGSRLIKESRNTAADCGFHLVRIDATNHYSALIAEKLKMKLVGEIPYCSYVAADTLAPIFNPPDPHKSVKIYVDGEPQNSTMKNK